MAFQPCGAELVFLQDLRTILSDQHVQWDCIRRHRHPPPLVLQVLLRDGYSGGLRIGRVAVALALAFLKLLIQLLDLLDPRSFQLVFVFHLLLLLVEDLLLPQLRDREVDHDLVVQPLVNQLVQLLFLLEGMQLDLVLLSLLVDLGAAAVDGLLEHVAVRLVVDEFLRHHPSSRALRLHRDFQQGRPAGEDAVLDLLGGELLIELEVVLQLLSGLLSLFHEGGVLAPDPVVDDVILRLVLQRLHLLPPDVQIVVLDAVPQFLGIQVAVALLILLLLHLQQILLLSRHVLLDDFGLELLDAQWLSILVLVWVDAKCSLLDYRLRSTPKHVGVVLLGLELVLRLLQGNDDASVVKVPVNGGVSEVGEVGLDLVIVEELLVVVGRLELLVLDEYVQLLIEGGLQVVGHAHRGRPLHPGLLAGLVLVLVQDLVRLQVNQELLIGQVDLGFYHVMQERLRLRLRFAIRLHPSLLRGRRRLALHFLPDVWDFVMKLPLDRIDLSKLYRLEVLRSFLVLHQDGRRAQDLGRIQGQELALHRPALGGSDLIQS